MLSWIYKNIILIKHVLRPLNWKTLESQRIFWTEKVPGRLKIMHNSMFLCKCTFGFSCWGWLETQLRGVGEEGSGQNRKGFKSHVRKQGAQTVLSMGWGWGGGGGHWRPLSRSQAGSRFCLERFLQQVCGESI